MKPQASFLLLPTFLLVLQKMTACVMVSVSYRSHRVSNFHSSFSTATKNCLIPSRVNSSLKRDGRGRWEESEGRGGWEERGEGGKSEGGEGGRAYIVKKSRGAPWPASPSALLSAKHSPLDENSKWVCHKLCSHLQHLCRQGGTDQDHLYQSSTDRCTHTHVHTHTLTRPPTL